MKSEHGASALWTIALAFIDLQLCDTDKDLLSGNHASQSVLPRPPTPRSRHNLTRPDECSLTQRGTWAVSMGRGIHLSGFTQDHRLKFWTEMPECIALFL